MILNDLSFTAEPGETVAFIGPSGCGKSTIIKLIQRLYDPMDGCVMLDGRDIKDISVNWLRKQIGIVGQEPVLFDMTILENILLGSENEHYSDETIAKVLDQAGAREFIQALPLGWNTPCGLKSKDLFEIINQF